MNAKRFLVAAVVAATACWLLWRDGRKASPREATPPPTVKSPTTVTQKPPRVGGVRFVTDPPCLVVEKRVGSSVWGVRAWVGRKGWPAVAVHRYYPGRLPRGLSLHWHGGCLFHVRGA